MNLFCFNSYRDPLFSLSRLVFEGGGDYVSNLGALEDGGPRREAAIPAADVSAAVLPDAQAPAPDVPAGPEAAKERDRARLRKGVESKLKKEAEKYLPKLREALENSDLLKKIREFVKRHGTFEKGKQRDWNLEFCDQVLGERPEAYEARLRVYALQMALNEKFQAISRDPKKGYPFHEKGSDQPPNSHTAIDGWMGGYTVSALAAYLNHKDAAAEQLAFTKHGDKNPPDYNRALKYLRGIFGDSETLSVEGLSEAYKHTLEDYQEWLTKRYPEESLDYNAIFEKPEFGTIFYQVVLYLQTHRDEKNFDEVFEEMNLTQEQIDWIWPPYLQELEPAAEAQPKEDKPARAPEGSPLPPEIQASIETMFSNRLKFTFENYKSSRKDRLDDIKEDLRTMREKGSDYTWYDNDLTDDTHTRPGSWPRRAFAQYESAYKNWQGAKRKYEALKGNPLAKQEEEQAKEEEARLNTLQQEAFKDLELAVAAYFKTEEELEKKVADKIRNDVAAEARKYDFPPGIDLLRVIQHDPQAFNALPSSFSTYVVGGISYLGTYFDTIPNRIFKSIDDVRAAAKADKVVQLGNAIKGSKIPPLDNINNAIYANNLIVFRGKADGIMNGFYAQLQTEKKASDQTSLDVAVARAKQEGWTLG